MRKTRQQLEQEALEARLLKEKREEYNYRFKEEDADRLGKAVHGSGTTEPVIIAALGLAGIPMDFQKIHQINAEKYRQSSSYKPDSNKFVRNNNKPQEPQLEPEPQSEYSIIDLFEFDRRQKQFGTIGKLAIKEPDWVSQLDPFRQWRDLEIPEKINDASELLQLNEVQAMKVLLSSGWENWQNIPNINDRGMWKDGKPVPGKEGVFDLIRNKFPNLKEAWDFYLKFEKAQKENVPFYQHLAEDFGPSMWLTKKALKIPTGILGWVTPDKITVPGTEKGINIEKGANIARGAVRGAVTGMAGAAQFTKSVIEWRILNPNGFTGSGIPVDLPAIDKESLDNFKKLVIEGNVLTQLAKQAFKDPKEIDLGSGFFPEGDIMRRANEAREEGLPLLGDGQTRWTFGRGLVEPLIQEGYIDRNGWAASIISGLADATFTAGTDPFIWSDPVVALMKAYKLAPTSASQVINGAAADRVLDIWAAERKTLNLPTKISNPLEMVYVPETNSWVYGSAVDPEDIPRFAGMLPPGAKLPPEVEKAVDEIVEKTLEGKSLATLDTPPPVTPYRPPSNTIQGFKQNLGIVDDGSGNLRLNPLAIDDMPNYADGRRALEKLTTFKNSGELWDAFLGNIPIGVAAQIQDYVDAARKAGTAPDLKEVHKILVDGVLAADPLYSVQTTPGVMKQWVGQTGKSIAQWTYGASRQFASMPNSTFFSFNDPMSSIKDMNNLMVVMKIPKTLRHEMISKAIKATTTEGPKARFDLANEWMKTVVGSKLRNQGVPELWIEKVTSWAGWSDGIHQWTMDRIGQGYYLPWLEDGTGEILRSVDFLNNGFLMVSPDAMRQVIRETTDFWKLMKPIRGNPAVEKVLNENISQRLETIQKGYLKPVALGAPFPVRMVTRIIPDEWLRFLVAGKFSPTTLKVGIMGNHVNYSTHGVVIRNAKQIMERIPLIDELDILAAELRYARKNGLTEMETRTLDSISEIEKKYGTKRQIEAEIKEFNRLIEKDIPGANRKVADNTRGLGSLDRTDPRVMRYERSQITEHAYKDSNPQQWVVGTSRDLVRMSQSEEYRVIARVMLGGNKDEIIDLPRRLLYGDLRPVLDRYRRGLANENPLMPLTSEEGITQFVQTIFADISERTAMDRVLIGAVATGRLGNKSIIKNAVDDLWDASPELKAFVRNNILNSPASPPVAPFYRTTASVADEATDNWLTKYFSLYRDASQKVARGPLFQHTKWRKIIDLMPVMSPDEAAKMAAAIDKSDAPEFLKKQVRDNVKYAEGTATRRQVETLGEMAGANRVDNVMYNYENKSYFGSKHALVFGFFDAWKEQWSVWMRQIAEQPSVLEKARLAKEGLTNAEVPSWAGGDPNRGILFKDEDTGQQMVALPFSKLAYSFLGINAEERIATKNLTLVGQAVPGFFGIGGMIFDSVLPKTEMFNGVRSTFFPYGDPTTKFEIADYIAPAWLQGISGAGLGMLERTFGRNNDLFSNAQELFTTETSDLQRATTMNAVLTNIAANADGAPVTGKAREQIIQDAQNKADALLIFKSVLRIFSPAASLTKYYVDTGQENVTTGKVLDDLRKFSEETETYSEAVTKLLDKYGDSAWIFLSGSTKSLPGMQPTKEYAKWFRDNEDFVIKYPSIGGYLGPQGGEFDPGAYSSQRSAGYRKPADLRKRQEDALNNMAWVLYNKRKQEIFKLGEQAGLTQAEVISSGYYKSQMKIKGEEIKKDFPLWSPIASQGRAEEDLRKQLAEIDLLVTNKKALSTSVGKDLAEYWEYRKRNIAKTIAKDPNMANETWRTSKSSEWGFRLRTGLSSYGQYLVKKNPAFSTIWDNVLSREFDPPEAG
jgi:hypothetical protein